MKRFLSTLARQAAVIAVLALFCRPCVSPVHSQGFSPVWKDLGPGQIRANAVNDWVNVEGMSKTNNPVTGAITKVLVDKSDSNLIYAGAVNGGIWKTTDGGKNWTPLTDRQASLSIGAMDFDASDVTGKTIIAGAGRQSAFAFASGPLTGIQYSADGGNNWAEKGRTELKGKDIVGVAARGDVMMAAVRNIDTPIDDFGLWRSTDGGKTFKNDASAVQGLPKGNLQSLAADPTNASRFYASVVNGNDDETGIYRSDDQGKNWKLVKAVSGLSTGESKGRILLSVGAQGVVVAQIQEGKTRLDLWRSADQGGAWTDMGKPATADFKGLFPSGQTGVHGAVLVDPANPNVVYAAGDTQYVKEVSGKAVFPNSIGAKQYSCPIFRGEYDPKTGVTTWTHITNNNTKSGSAPHADARTFAVDKNGRLLFGGDGGLNALPTPGSAKTDDWIPIMDTLRTTEMTQSHWNPITHTVSAAAQDVGAFYQYPGQRGTYDWSSTNGGDGGPGPVNAVTFKDRNLSVVYASNQNLGGFRRFEVGKSDDAAAAKKTATYLDPQLNGVSIGGNGTYMSFLSLVVLNREDPRKMALGGKQLFIGTDDPNQKYTNPDESYFFPVTSILSKTTNPAKLPENHEISAIAYGAKDKANALLAGSGNGDAHEEGGGLYYTASAGATAMTALSGYGGKYVYNAIFDERDAARFYVADGKNIWRSTDTGANFTNFNGAGATALPANFVDRRGLAFAAANGVNALFVGGVSDTANGSGVYVTRFTAAPGSDGGTPTWSSFGGSLANAPVYGLSYNAPDDVLLVNLFGRGAWVVYDLTSYFPEATTLIFGKADNDSAPAASLLADGTPVDGGAAFARTLIKSGAGTLTMPNAATTYTGGTQFDGGAIAAYSDGSFGTAGNWSFDGGKLKYLAGFTSSRGITLAGAGGTFDTNGFNATLAGLVSGGGGLNKDGAGTLTITRDNAYTGDTTINAGILAVNNPDRVTGSGTGTGNVTIEANGQLTGTGRVAGDVVNNGKGNPGSSAGKLVIGGTYTQGESGVLEIEISNTEYDVLEVQGKVALNGTLKTILLNGHQPGLGDSYSVVTAAAVSGRFSSLDTAVNNAGTIYFKPKYFLSKVDIVLERDYAANLRNRGFSANQQAVGDMLNSVANTAAGLSGDLNAVLTSIDNLAGDRQVAAALDQLASRGDASAAVTSQNDSRLQIANIANRLQDLRSGVQGLSIRGLNLMIEENEDLNRHGRPVLLAFNGSGLPAEFTLPASEKWGIFATGSATAGKYKNSSASSDTSFRGAGLTVGTDYRFTGEFAAGIMLGYSRTRSDLDELGSRASLNAFQVGLYGTYYDRRGFFCDALGGYGWNGADKDRRIVYPGVDRTATSDQNGQTWTLSGAAGWDFHLNNWILTPKIALDYIRLNTDDYTESGAGSLNLQVNGESSRLFLGQIGGSVAYVFPLERGTIMPRLWAMYGREFDPDDQVGTTARLAMGSAAFTTYTIPPDRGFLNLGGGITAGLSPRTTLYLNVGGQVGQSNYSSYYLDIGFRLSF